MKEAQTIKIWKDTLLNLRLLHAYTGRPMVEVLDRVIREALDKEFGSETNRSDGAKVRKTDGC